MIKFYNLDFCTAELYNDYAIVVMKQGVTVSPKYIGTFLKIVNKHYKNKPFVYISHRINSYSVNPATHLQSSKVPSLIGVAVVSDDPLQKIQTKVEKPFFEKEFKHFNTIEEALKWKDQIIKKYID
ncbi:SpoIIAA family protein [Aquimarina mytili]|uniref:STAS/SEC14 domain-containing protein n=1 Tax=Aquimarina mytili TaxID=874423 RepID=A0A937A6V5_9FLAO|nr:STAS/SEC14 domain-containing protein [Aquimarina mytili]MBL0685955.1 STAS/SEC14 domain-containing protein [Aquimarina mytili]